MELIIGGAYQGKSEFVCSHYQIESEDITDGETCSMEPKADIKVLNHLHEYIRRLLLQEQDAHKEILGLIKQNPDMILICNELGCGLVPVDAFDRRYRECVGRILCELAKEAKSVYRVYCGIGVKLK